MNRFRLWFLRLLIGKTPVIANISFIRPTRVSDHLSPITKWQDKLGGDAS